MHINRKTMSDGSTKVTFQGNWWQEGEDPLDLWCAVAGVAGAYFPAKMAEAWKTAKVRDVPVAITQADIDAGVKKAWKPAKVRDVAGVLETIATVQRDLGKSWPAPMTELGPEPRGFELGPIEVGSIRLRWESDHNDVVLNWGRDGWWVDIAHHRPEWRDVDESDSVGFPSRAFAALRHLAGGDVETFEKLIRRSGISYEERMGYNINGWSALQYDVDRLAAGLKTSESLDHLYWERSEATGEEGSPGCRLQGKYRTLVCTGYEGLYKGAAESYFDGKDGGGEAGDPYGGPRDGSHPRFSLAVPISNPTS